MSKNKRVIWAISDLHLSFGTPNKAMKHINSTWENYEEKVKKSWEKVSDKDIVLLPGDLSWGLKWSEVEPDLEWLSKLKGTKILVKGNHDLWWGSNAKMRKLLPEGILFIHRNSISISNIGFFGTRMWVHPGSSLWLKDYIDLSARPKYEISKKDNEIYEREWTHLKSSLASLPEHVTDKIALIHFPPCAPSMERTDITKFFSENKISTCIFGHLHAVPKLPYRSLDGVEYILASCDCTDFELVKIREVELIDDSNWHPITHA